MENRQDMSKKILSYENVSIAFFGQEVLHQVSFDLHKGEVLGLLGESGSGKSTLIRAAMGVLDTGGRVSGGQIVYRPDDENEKTGRSTNPGGEEINPGGEEINSAGQKPGLKMNTVGREINLRAVPEKKFRELRGGRIGMIFQDAGAALCPIRTIGSQILESISAHRRMDRKEAEAAALELFGKLNLWDPQKIWQSYPFEMSGGMNQRIGIAMAMLMHPDILLADEPTSALDAVTAEQVLWEMQEVHRLFGTSMILVTHDIAVMEKMADRIVVLQNGQVIENGCTREILQQPRQPYTKRLVASVPRLIIGKEAGNCHTDDSKNLSGSIESSEPRRNSDPRDCQAANTDTILLHTEHLTKTFYGKNGRKTEAVRDVTFTLHRGEILGILGESGSGKSTLARLITGLTAVDEGKICIVDRKNKADQNTNNKNDKKHLRLMNEERNQALEGEEKGEEKELAQSGCKSELKRLNLNKKRNRKQDSHSRRRKHIEIIKQRGKRKSIGRVQMVFQNPVNSFDPRRTLGYGIRESLVNQGMPAVEADKRTQDLLVRCGLPKEYAFRYPKEVSGGECQRAAIARALAAEPDILICDEATSSLDVTLQQQIVELLKDLQANQDLSVIFICHNLALAQKTCDRILIMNRGSIVEEGDPDEIVNQMILKTAR